MIQIFILNYVIKTYFFIIIINYEPLFTFYNLTIFYDAKNKEVWNLAQPPISKGKVEGWHTAICKGKVTGWHSQLYAWHSELYGGCL